MPCCCGLFWAVFGFFFPLPECYPFKKTFLPFSLSLSLSSVSLAVCPFLLLLIAFFSSSGLVPCCCVLCSSRCSSEMYIGLVHASIFHSCCCCCSIFAFSLLLFAFTHPLLELACFFPRSRSWSSWMQLRPHCIIGFGYASACVDSSSSSSHQRLPLTPKQSCRLVKRWRTSEREREREREMWVLVT